MTTGVEGEFGPGGHGPDVEYGFSDIEFTPMTLEELEEMYKRNLLIWQQLEEATIDFSWTGPAFGGDAFRVDWTDGEMDVYLRVRQALARGEDPAAAVPVFDMDKLPSNAELGEEFVVTIDQSGSVVPAGEAPAVDKEYKRDGETWRWVPPGGEDAYGVEPLDGAVMTAPPPLPNQIIPTSLIDGRSANAGNFGAFELAVMIDPDNQGIRFFLIAPELGPEGGIFAHPITPDATLSMTLGADAFTSGEPMAYDPELFASPEEYDTYLAAYDRFHELVEQLNDRQSAILTGAEAPPRPPAARFAGDWERAFSALMGAGDTFLDLPRLAMLLLDGRILPVSIDDGSIRLGNESLLTMLGARDPEDPSLYQEFSELMRAAYGHLGLHPESFEGGREMMELASLLVTGAQVLRGAENLVRGGINLFRRPGGQLVVQVPVPDGALDMPRVATLLRRMAEQPPGEPGLHPTTLSQILENALAHPNAPGAVEVYEAARELQRQVGGADLRAHALLTSGIDPASWGYDLQSIMRQYTREAGLSTEVTHPLGNQLLGELNTRTPQARLDLLQTTDINALVGLEPHLAQGRLSPAEQAIVTARLANNSPTGAPGVTSYVDLGELHAQRAPEVPGSVGAGERAYDQAGNIGATPPDLTVGSSGPTANWAPDVSQQVTNRLDGFMNDAGVPPHLRAEFAERARTEIGRRAGTDPANIDNATNQLLSEMTLQPHKLGLYQDLARIDHNRAISDQVRSAVTQIWPVDAPRYKLWRELSSDLQDMSVEDARAFLERLARDPDMIADVSWQAGTAPPNFTGTLQLPDVPGANARPPAFSVAVELPDGTVTNAIFPTSGMSPFDLLTLDSSFIPDVDLPLSAFEFMRNPIGGIARFGRAQGALLPEGLQAFTRWGGDTIRSISPDELQNLGAAARRGEQWALERLSDLSSLTLRAPLENVLQGIPYPVRDFAGNAIDVPRSALAQLGRITSSDPAVALQTFLTNGVISLAILSAPHVELSYGIVGEPGPDGEPDPVLMQRAEENFVREGSRALFISTRNAENAPLNFTAGGALFLPGFMPDGTFVPVDVRSGAGRCHTDKCLSSDFRRIINATGIFNLDFPIDETLGIGSELSVRYFSSNSILSSGSNFFVLSVNPDDMGRGGSGINVLQMHSEGGTATVDGTGAQWGSMALIVGRGARGGEVLVGGTPGGAHRPLNARSPIAITIATEWLSTNPNVLRGIQEELQLMHPNIRAMHLDFGTTMAPLRTDPETGAPLGVHALAEHIERYGIETPFPTD